MSNWNDINRMRLIECFRKRPELWCSGTPEFGELSRRREAVRSIVDYMNQFELPNEQFTQEEIRTQFKNLKDMYRRKVKKMQQLQEVAHKVEEPSWYYFQHLKFLDFKTDNSASRSPTPIETIPSIKAEVPSVIGETMPLEQLHQVAPATTSTTHMRISMLRRRGPTKNELPVKRQRAAPQPVTMVSVTEGPTSPPPPSSSAPTSFCSSGAPEDDHLGMFGQFVAQTLRNMSTTTPALAIQVKRQIHDILCEAELNQLGFVLGNNEQHPEISL